MLASRSLVSIITHPCYCLSTFFKATMKNNNHQTNKSDTKRPKRPFTNSDLEAVLKAATKPLKKEQGEKEPEETSKSRHPDD